MIVDTNTGTRIDEIQDGIYRISTPVPPSAIPGGFSFNQFLIVGDEPALFHTGMRSLFPLVRQAIDRVLPVERLRYLGLSHFEADEMGALNDFLALAPRAQPLCSRIGAMVSVDDQALRPAHAMAGGDRLDIGGRTLRWIDAPHLPHNWETGYLFDERTATLFCGDIFTQGGENCPPVTSADILDASEAFRQVDTAGGSMDYCGVGRDTRMILARLAACGATTLACMHGSSWRGSAEGAAAMLTELGDRLGAPALAA